MAVYLKRVYEKPAPGDGERILVDRMWPRGVSKGEAKIDLWLKDIAPSSGLRKWFAHDPVKWRDFKVRYFRELAANPDGLRELTRRARARRITLVFAARDEKHNNAVAIKEYLGRRQRSLKTGRLSRQGSRDSGA